MEQAQVGDIIEIINNNQAFWVKKGNRYTVLSVCDPYGYYGNKYLKLDSDINSDYYWACSTHDYKITYRCSGESTTDADIEAYKEKVRKEALLKEAKELYPPGTKFMNKQGSISIISDNPEYTHSTSKDGIYARTITGKLVYIYYDGKWYDIVKEESSLKGPATVTSTPRARLKAGDRIYIVSNAKGTARKYAGTNVTVMYDPYYYGNDSYHVTVENEPALGFLLTPDEWEYSNIATWLTSKSNTDTFNFEEAKERYRESLKYESWDEFIYNRFNKTNKNQQNGTESNKSVKLQGTNLQIREGNPVRGIGLKSSGSKIKLGSNNSYN